MFRSTSWPRGAGSGGVGANSDRRLPKCPRRGRVVGDAGPSARMNAAGLTPELSRAEGVGLNDWLGVAAYQIATTTTNPIARTATVAATPMKVMPAPQSLQYASLESAGRPMSIGRNPAQVTAPGLASCSLQRLHKLTVCDP